MKLNKNKKDKQIAKSSPSKKIEPLPFTNTFFIAVDSSIIRGSIVGFKVTMGTEIIPIGTTIRFDLVDHPHYHLLHKYCENNPVRTVINKSVRKKKEAK